MRALKANIQTAATKVTNMLYLSFRGRPFRHTKYCLRISSSFGSVRLAYANYYLPLPCIIAARSEQIGTVKMTPILEATPCMISIPMSNILIICKYS